MPWRRERRTWEQTVCQGGKVQGVTGQIAPRTAGEQEGDDVVADPTQVHDSGAASGLGAREQGFVASPCAVTEVTEVTEVTGGDN